MTGLCGGRRMPSPTDPYTRLLVVRPTSTTWTIAERITAAIREPFVVGDLADPIYVTASVGVAHGPAESADTLLRKADVALYEAKARGKGGYVVAGV